MEEDLHKVRHSNFLSITSSFILIMLLIALSGNKTQGVTGQVDTSARRQVLEGLGAANVWSGFTMVDLANVHPEIYDVLFGDLGLDILRLRNTYTYSSDTYYMNNCAKTISEGRARTGRPLKIMISSWSPGAYLKSNSNINGGYNATLAKDANDPNNGPYNYVYDRYAQWWYESLAAWDACGIQADYISMQNEPDFDTSSYESCRFNATEGSTVAGYKQAFQALYNKINTIPAANRPKLLAPETATLSAASGYINALSAADLSNIYGYGHHLYDFRSSPSPDYAIPLMTSFGATYNNKPLMMTEFSKQVPNYSVTTFNDAMSLALFMHNSLAVEGVSSYIYWDLTWEPPRGLVTISPISWTINPVYYAMKHYSAFTDPGWQRVDASTDSNNLRISAYISPDNDKLSVVIIDTDIGPSANLNLSFANFQVIDGNIYRSTSTQNCVNIGSYTGGTLTIPAYSFTTLSLRGLLTGQYRTLDCSSTIGGTVTKPGPGSFRYEPGSTVTIIATPNPSYHLVNWTGTAVTAGKVADANAPTTTVLMDNDYTLIANFEVNPYENTPPSPNPLVWASVPTATGSSTITMTASTATDSCNPPVQYYFECTNHNEANSAWQSSPTYTAAGLTSDTLYSFRVKARDSYIVPNETAYSEIASATTISLDPNIRILGSWMSGKIHTKENGQKRALVFIAHGKSTTANNPAVTSVTYGGQAMTKIIDSNVLDSSGRNYVAAFILNEAGVAAATDSYFVTTWSGGATTYDYYASAFLGNVDQTNPVEANDSNSSISSSLNTIVTDHPLVTHPADMVILGAT